MTALGVVPQTVGADEVPDDDSVEVTPDGVVVSEPSPFDGLPDYVVDMIVAADTAEAAEATSASPATAEAPSASEAFRLNSRPGADLTIYLDFDGHTTTGTPWNGEQSNGTRRPDSFTSAPYTRDSNPALSNSERLAIGQIWEQVSEDYAAFDVNVTTEEPANSDLIRAGSTDRRYGVRVVISPTDDWYGSSGGVAYINSFVWTNSLTPAFVFSDALAGGHAKYVAEAASHEVGHTLGLYHDGKGSSPYYGGHDVRGGGGWAPIMGVGYGRATTQWSSGLYTGATQTQNDLAILATRLGRANDDLTSTPTLSNGDSRRVVVDDADDALEVDVVVLAGVATIDVVPAVPNSNLLASAQLLDGNQVIATASPSSSTNWSLRVQRRLAAGTYTLRLQAIGWATPDDGFPDEGSLGQALVSLAVVEDSIVTTTTTTTTTSTTTTTTTTSTVPTSGPTTTGPTTTQATTTTTQPATTTTKPKATTTTTTTTTIPVGSVTNRPSTTCGPDARGLIAFSASQVASAPSCYRAAERLG